jgi:hypothetical protein
MSPDLHGRDDLHAIPPLLGKSSFCGAEPHAMYVKPLTYFLKHWRRLSKCMETAQSRDTDNPRGEADSRNYYVDHRNSWSVVRSIMKLPRGHYFIAIALYLVTTIAPQHLHLALVGIRRKCPLIELHHGQTVER